MGMPTIQLFSFPSLDSTSLEARRRLSSCALPFAVHSEVQTAGYGQQGRTWQSPRGNLYITLALPLTGLHHPLPLLPLRAAVTVARWIETVWQVPVKLKWPNDIMHKGRKLAGILCETSLQDGVAESVLIGVGINVQCAPEENLGPGAYPSVALAELVSDSGWTVGGSQQWAELLLERWAALWEMNRADILREFTALQLGPGEKWVSTEGLVYRDSGISEAGFLQLEGNGERIELVSGSHGFRWVP